MTTLITGGLGFIGSYVARDLLDRGERVVTLDWMVSRNTAHEVLGPEALDRLTVLSGDVSDPHLMARVVKEHSIQRVVHLAALLTTDAAADPPLALRVNCQGLVNVLEAARLFPLQRVVWASSCGVLGPQERHPPGPVANDAALYPETVYAASKAFGERLAEHYHNAYGVDAIGLRFNVVYGRGRKRGGAMFTAEMFEKPVRGEPAVVDFGDDTCCWQHVEDVAGTIVAALDVGSTTVRNFNTCGFTRSVREVADLVRELVPGAQFMFRPGRTNVAWNIDDSRAVAELGYRGRITPEEGVRRSLRALGVSC